MELVQNVGHLYLLLVACHDHEKRVYGMWTVGHVGSMQANQWHVTQLGT